MLESMICPALTKLGPNSEQQTQSKLLLEGPASLLCCG